METAENVIGRPSSLDDMTGDVLAYTCLLHVHRDAICKHMAAVENATVDDTLTAFPSEDEPNDDGV